MLLKLSSAVLFVPLRLHACLGLRPQQRRGGLPGADPGHHDARVPLHPGAQPVLQCINHYTTSPSKSVTLDSLPVLRSEHSPYRSFNNIGHRGHDGGFYKDEELNDSDSERMRVVVAAQEGSQGEGTAKWGRGHKQKHT